MSSATSTSEVRLKPDTSGVGDVRLKPDAASPGMSTFRASHFFVLASLVAATGAVIMSRQSTPEHLVLISLMIASAGLAAAGFYRTMSPLVGDASAMAAEGGLSERARAVLAREKALVLRALKDLEFDRSMGKVSQADFEEMAARLRTRALSLMKQLDDDGTGYRTIIERELNARLTARAAAGRLAGQPVEPEPAPVASTEGLCSCGTPNDADAHFCKRCGTKLAHADGAPASSR
jgi:hypothetical protein